MPITGSYGLILLFDAKTEKRAQMLSGTLVETPEFTPTIPHLTLHHAQIREAPEGHIKHLLEALSFLDASQVSFHDIQVYREKYLFWEARMTSRLRAGHLIALHLADFLDRTGSDPGRYGHPLAFDHFRPHLTLAGDRTGRLQHRATTDQVRFTGRVTRVAFARMGSFGRVEELISL